MKAVQVRVSNFDWHYGVVEQRRRNMPKALPAISGNHAAVRNGVVEQRRRFTRTITAFQNGNAVVCRY